MYKGPVVEGSMKNKTEADLCSWSRKSKISGHKMKLKKAGGGQTTKIYGSCQGISLYLNTETMAQDVTCSTLYS